VKECSNAVEHGGGPADRVKMNVSMSRVKKMTSSSSLVKRRHGVGAVGYAVVQPDQRIPDNQFFEPQRKFRIRFRFVSFTDAVYSVITMLRCLPASLKAAFSLAKARKVKAKRNIAAVHGNHFTAMENHATRPPTRGPPGITSGNFLN